MSKVQVDKVVNLSDDGAPQLTYGAELPVGYGLTGAGGLNITGVVTAASAVFSGNVTIGGTLTYEDVTNIDVVGVSTFAGRMNVNSSALFNEGLSVTAGVTTIAGTSTYAGTATYAGDVSIADKIIHTGDTNTALRFPSADTFTVETGGSERLRVDSSGNIGIGTASASERLEVYPDANRALILRDKASTTYGMEIFNNSGNTSGEIHLTAASAGSVVINRSGSETARFNGSGQLLLGTTTEGHSNADDLTVATASATGITIRSGTSHNGSLFFSDATSGTGEYAGYLQYNHGSNSLEVGTASAARIIINSVGITSIQGADDQDNFIVNCSGTEFAVHTDTSDGEVSLRAQDQVGSTNAKYMTFFTQASGSAAVEALKIDSTGNMSIGGCAVNTFSNYRTLTIGGAGASTGSGLDLELDDGTIYGRIFADTNGLQIGAPATDDYIRFETDGGTERLRIAGDGHVRVGSGDPTYELELVGTGAQHLLVGSTNAGGSTLILDGDSNGDGSGSDYVTLKHTTDGNLDISNRKTASIIFRTGSSEDERARITSSGEWMVATTSSAPDTASTVSGMTYSSSKLRVARNSDACLAVNRNSTTGDIVQLNYNGTQRGSISTDGTVIAFNTSSDYRLKENAAAITDGITRLKTLKPYRFNWKSVGVGTTVDGFLAHEVTAVPEAITGTKDLVTTSSDVSAGIATAVGIPIYQGIDQSKLVPLLTAALQEAVEETESLKTLIKNSSSFAALKSSL
jgi:hypothetical protein